MAVEPGGFRLSVTSDTGVSNQIQVLSDWTQGVWVSVTNILVTQSPYSFVDSTAAGDRERFYRIVQFTPATALVPTNMALIPSGTFQMGDTFNEGEASELPVHEVYVSAFYMQKYEVTKGLWDEVLSWSQSRGYSYDHLGEGKAANHPVENINWYDMVKWCNARSEMEGRTPAYYTDAGLTQVYRSGNVAPFVNWTTGFRLPTEAEWERASRGGAAGHRFPWTESDVITHTNANYYSDSSFPFDVSATRGFNPAFVDDAMPYTSPVGSFAPNGYGLYDTAGNVWEWCWDYAAAYPSDPQTDPHGPSTGSTRIGRGGNWNYYPVHCRNAYRYGNPPDYSASNIGFRCALSVPHS